VRQAVRANSALLSSHARPAPAHNQAVAAPAAAASPPGWREHMCGGKRKIHVGSKLPIMTIEHQAERNPRSDVQPNCKLSQGGPETRTRMRRVVSPPSPTDSSCRGDAEHRALLGPSCLTERGLLR
jgi:hypothetical protein